MTIEDIEKVKRSVIRKYPVSLGLALKEKEIELDNSISTAAVVGEKDEKGKINVKKIKINPDFFARLTFSERVFVLAHEACHIALHHFSRALSYPEKDAQKKYDEYCQKETDPQKRIQMKNYLLKKYHNIWNIATDACINAFLKKDGLDFPKNVVDPQTGQKMEFVDIEDGLYRSAEKIYKFLVNKEEEKEKNKDKNKKQGEEQQNNEQNQNGEQPSQPSDEQNQNGEQPSQPNDQSNKSEPSMGDLDDIDVDNYNGFDSHEEWTEEKHQLDRNDNTKKEFDENKEKEETQADLDSQDETIDEEKIFESEREARKSNVRPRLKESLSKVRMGIGLGKNVAVKPVISWKRLLVGTLEKVEEVWGTRRASRYNPNARIEERIYEESPSVEVILDVSGSISKQLLQGFLMQLCPLFESLYGDMKMRVGCFSDNFQGFYDIKTKKDILDFQPKIGGNTYFEIAATSFTKDPGHKTTKIVFTDGCLGYPQKTRVDDIIWIVFGDQMNFTPIGGRIIRVSKEELKNMAKLGLETFENEEEKQFTI